METYRTLIPKEESVKYWANQQGIEVEFGINPQTGAFNRLQACRDADDNFIVRVATANDQGWPRYREASLEEMAAFALKAKQDIPHDPLTVQLVEAVTVRLTHILNDLDADYFPGIME